MIEWLAIIWCIGSTFYFWNKETQPWYTYVLDFMASVIVVGSLINVI